MILRKVIEENNFTCNYRIHHPLLSVNIYIQTSKLQKSHKNSKSI